MPALNQILTERLAEAEKRGLKRVLTATRAEAGALVTRNGRQLLNFSGNDYLGLRAHPRVVEAAQAALREYGAGSGAARLVSGNHPLYAALEADLAAYKGMETALVFGSGYLANLGVISALMGEGDLILADKLAHACMLDGARLSGATVKRFAHNDMAHLEQLLASHRAAHRHCLILTESVFSMDGDLAPMAALRALAERHDAWLLADDAHGIGMINNSSREVGRGATTAQTEQVSPPPNLPPAGGGINGPHIWIGTLSKALGSYGGYVAGSRVLIDYLISHARSFIFSTALPPMTVAAAHTALTIMRQEPERGQRVLLHARAVTDAVGLPAAQSAIVPIVLGEPENAVTASRALEERGLYVSAIRPPTVPPGTARLRITFSASHTKDDIARLIAALGMLQRNA